jgi:hypothetical protein
LGLGQHLADVGPEFLPGPALIHGLRGQSFLAASSGEIVVLEPVLQTIRNRGKGTATAP